MVLNKNDNIEPSKDVKVKSEEKIIAAPKPITPTTIDFQLCDWNSYHEIDGEDEEKYVIQLFGRTADDKDVCLKVTGFTPFFYVEVPLHWKKKQADKFVEVLKNKVAWSTSNNPNYDFDLSESLIRHALVQKHKFYNFSKKKLFNFVMLVFKSHTAMREYSNMLARPLKAVGLTKDPMLYQRFESNIEPHIRFMHINNLFPCGWVTIDINKSKAKVNKEYSNCDYSYQVHWKEVKPILNNDTMAPFKIMGYDLECISCDHNFPRADRKTDKIIQIGITMYRYGSMNCYSEHIVVLKECDDINGANVQCYKTEKGLIRGWAKLVSEIRPDFKAGYNNFGFDDKYIYDRIHRIDKEAAEKSGVSIDNLENKFMDEIMQIIGKVNNKYLMEVEGLKKSQTYFEVKQLSSSALGDNELKFIQVPGILSVDMMKVIQRDHRLVGYKLDNVSANFITEGAAKFIENGETADGKVKIDIYTRSTKALEKNSYVQIMVDDGYSSSPLSENAKYKVNDICTITEKKKDKDGKEEKIVYQCIKTIINIKDVAELREAFTNPLLKIYWTFAKDDMHHTLINKYFKEGDPKKIRQIAKYCLKDCKLVNLLMAKLEIIVNSVGMANVCNVPLSYLFLRGQGVKIFSLVSKKCRQKNFLIPVLRRKKTDATGDEEETYEGATVITPKPGVYLSPIGVLDYSSLYPNSMRERNLSQECYVNDPKYNNLDGYIYHDVDITLKDKKGKIIRNIDGTAQKDHHRFAQELISDDQINIELKDIFDSIENTKNTNVDAINKQTYFTHANRKFKLDKEEAIYKKQVKEINNNNSTSRKSKDKLLETAKDNYQSIIGKLADQEKRIADERSSLDSKIKEINDDKTLSEPEKKKQLKIKEADSNEVIDSIVKEIKLTKKDKEELIENENEQAKKSISDEKAKKYNVVNGKGVRYGILPEILTELLNKRKETNGRLAKEKDPSIKSVLNGLQLAFKVTANSLYGQTGAPTSPIFFIAIAASTTAVGRERLHYAKKIVEDNFPGSEVIYGDSVTGDTPIIYKDHKGDINITTIEELGKQWQPYDQFKAGESNRKDKQQSIVPGVQVWTSTGWANVTRVIRHKTVKKIYRILTDTGCIDVTEDHSLLDKNKNIIKPVDCNIGTELLHGFMEPNYICDKMTKKEAFNQGLSSQINQLNNNLVPKEILNGTIEIKQSFVDGYFASNSECLDCKINGKINTQCLFYLLKSLGYYVTIDCNKEDLDMYQLTFTKNHSIKNDVAVKEKYLIRETTFNSIDDYVYDLETVDGTFHAGIGELIVKNTDSIFINFHLKDENGIELTDKQALMRTIELCQQAAAMINSNVPKPQSIIYEKTMHPFILVAKKKYVGLLFEKDPEKYYLKSMGIVLKRRDNAPIVKIVVGGIIDYILKNRDIDKAVEYTKQVLRKLMDGEYPIEKFIISKNLRGNYKQKKNVKTGKLTSLPAHKVLADRMAARDPGNKPQVNDRIPFVYIIKDMGTKKKKDILQGDLIEHPAYVIENGLKIDYMYYLEHQIINPAQQILELMLPTKQVEKLFNEYLIEEDNKRKGRQSIEKWMDYSTFVKSDEPNEDDEPAEDDESNEDDESSEQDELDEDDVSSEQYESNEDESEELSKKKSVNSKNVSPKKDSLAKTNPYNNLVFIGKTKRLECQNINKWLQKTDGKVNSDEWEPII